MMDNAPILLAEDNENDIFLLRRAFAKAELKNPLYFVTDGEEVLAYLKGEGEFADRSKFPFPQLVLLDLKMPRMDGLETLAQIRKDPLLRRLVVIFLTSSDEMRDINDAFDLRLNSYLVKPRNTETLVETLKKIKNYWLNLNEFPNCPEGKE